MACSRDSLKNGIQPFSAVSNGLPGRFVASHQRTQHRLSASALIFWRVQPAYHVHVKLHFAILLVRNPLMFLHIIFPGMHHPVSTIPPGTHVRSASARMGRPNSSHTNVTYMCSRRRCCASSEVPLCVPVSDSVPVLQLAGATRVSHTCICLDDFVRRHRLLSPCCYQVGVWDS